MVLLFWKRVEMRHICLSFCLIYFYSLEVYDISSDTAFVIQSKSVKYIHCSLLFLTGNRAQLWTSKMFLSMTCISLGWINLWWKYLICSSLCRMISEKKTLKNGKKKKINSSSQATSFVSILFPQIYGNRMDTKPVAWDNEINYDVIILNWGIWMKMKTIKMLHLFISSRKTCFHTDILRSYLLASWKNNFSM